MVAVWRCAIIRGGSLLTVMVERETRALSVAGVREHVLWRKLKVAPSHKYEKLRFPALEYHLDFTLSLTVTARACIVSRRQN